MSSAFDGAEIDSEAEMFMEIFYDLFHFWFDARIEVVKMKWERLKRGNEEG